MPNDNLKRLIEQFLETTRQPIHAYDDASHRHKELFHTYGKAILKQIAEDLGYASGTYDIRSNKGGIAGCGEVTLHTEDLYVQLAQSCYAYGLEILYRTCKGRNDYCGGYNNWLSFTDLRAYKGVLRKFNSLKRRQSASI